MTRQLGLRQQSGPDLVVADQIPPLAPRASRSASSGEETRAPLGLVPVGRLFIPQRPVAPLLVPELPPGMPTLPVIAASA